jgi:hypothetical protein
MTQPSAQQIFNFAPLIKSIPTGQGARSRTPKPYATGEKETEREWVGQREFKVSHNKTFGDVS